MHAGGAGTHLLFFDECSLINTGDGVGMAARCEQGVPLEDMEFWQFHPTGVAGAGVLITEGVRGEGGFLRNERWRSASWNAMRQMPRISLRATSCRAPVVTEINEGRGCGPANHWAIYVMLDITHLDPHTIMQRLPGIHEISIQFAGGDPIKAPIPVVPTLSLPDGRHSDRTIMAKSWSMALSVAGFYAAGECACESVPGANRLGTRTPCSTCWSSAGASGESMVEFIRKEPSCRSYRKSRSREIDKCLARVLICLNTQTHGADVHEMRGPPMQRTMQNHAGVFRFKDMLATRRRQGFSISRSRLRRPKSSDKSQVWNTARIEALELDNLIEVAKATIISANARTESRGAHVRDDAPDTPERPNGRDDANWLKHSLWHREGNRLDWRSRSSFSR